MSDRTFIMKHLLWLWLMTVALSVAADDGQLVFSDDFENGARQSPPPGWSMWGDAKFKVAADFTRDTSCAHGGTASFRIHHPAATGGYIVSSP